VLGLNGEFSNDWHWDMAYNYSRNTGNDGWTFDLDKEKAAKLLMRKFVVQMLVRAFLVVIGLGSES